MVTFIEKERRGRAWVLREKPMEDWVNGRKPSSYKFNME